MCTGPEASGPGLGVASPATMSMHQRLGGLDYCVQNAIGGVADGDDSKADETDALLSWCEATGPAPPRSDFLLTHLREKCNI